MRRYVIDVVGNYLFFVPVVIVCNAWAWRFDPAIIFPYMLSSLVIAAVSGRLFTWFLEHVWYPAWNIEHSEDQYEAGFHDGVNDGWQRAMEAEHPPEDDEAEDEEDQASR